MDRSTDKVRVKNSNNKVSKHRVFYHLSLLCSGGRRFGDAGLLIGRALQPLSAHFGLNVEGLLLVALFYSSRLSGFAF